MTDQTDRYRQDRRANELLRKRINMAERQRDALLAALRTIAEWNPPWMPDRTGKMAPMGVPIGSNENAITSGR